LIVASPAAFGQAQRGNIEVTVTDADGQAIPGATVNAVSDETLSRRTVLSDDQGKATIVALDPATNYVVTVSLDGFATQIVNDVAIRAGQTQTLAVELGLAEVSEELIVTAESPLVDVSKTQAGQDITLQLTESLPTARTYQDYLQLVPGVQDSLGDTDNPASRSGVNYRDRDDSVGDVGFSTDNLYYFDGINVTDRVLGMNGADLNTEIIQEQSVLTGAIPAEFVGAPGLISNVVTKSGGNDFSGSVNYYLQNDSLVESNDHFPEEGFSTFDAAATLGGPIVRDKAWFFASFRSTEQDRDVVNEDGAFLRNAKLTSDQLFGKATWAITDSDVFSGTYLTDPRDQTGRFERDIPNEADSVRERGGERFSVGYNRVWGSAALELAVTDHEGDRNVFPKNQANLNEVSFAPGVIFTSAEETLGGSGTNIVENRATESQRASLEYLFDTSWGDHALKFGVVTTDSTLFEDESTSGSPPATFISLSGGGTVELCAILGTCVGGSTQSWSTADFGTSTDETQGFRENLTGSQTQTLLGVWDDNNNGVLDDPEIRNNMTFSSTDGNPNGLINYTRDLQTQSGANEKGSESLHYYIQDAWQWNKWSINAGLRAEETNFVASTGETLSDFDTAVAPRLSISYDLNGDGRSSIGLFYGEYYDAFRDTAIDFAGTLTGRVIEEQVYVDELGEWVNFRTRGGATTVDGSFAPRIETPVTEELQIQYKRDLGRNMMIEINLIDRETSDIAEDYGSIYFDAAQYSDNADINDPGSFFLGPQYFGYNNFDAIPTNFNFLLGTLPPEAFRDWQGLELVFRKRYSDNWQLLASYNYADADANTNSDGAFDGAGDVMFLDPRAPNRTGVQPGLVENLFKVHGSYHWDNGFQVGGSYRWNSGFILNRNQGISFGRSLPDRTETPFASNGWPGGGFDDNWIAPDAIGAISGRSYGVLDIRGSYVWEIGDRADVDFFVDIFNLLDDQQVIQVQDLVSGGEGFEFLEGRTFVDPRRYFLGARLRF
jgi:hypothetical protein